MSAVKPSNRNPLPNLPCYSTVIIVWRQLALVACKFLTLKVKCHLRSSKLTSQSSAFCLTKTALAQEEVDCSLLNIRLLKQTTAANPTSNSNVCTRWQFDTNLYNVNRTKNIIIRNKLIEKPTPADNVPGEEKNVRKCKTNLTNSN